MNIFKKTEKLPTIKEQFENFNGMPCRRIWYIKDGELRTHGILKDRYTLEQLYEVLEIDAVDDVEITLEWEMDLDRNTPLFPIGCSIIDK